MGCAPAFPVSVGPTCVDSLPSWPFLALSASCSHRAHSDLLSLRLCRFWKRAGFVPVYLRQTPVSRRLAEGGVGLWLQWGQACPCRALCPAVCRAGAPA